MRPAPRRMCSSPSISLPGASPDSASAMLPSRDSEGFPMPTLASSSPGRRVPALIGRVIRWLDDVPYSVLAVPLRFAVATVFWNSAMTKLANWDTAIALFVDEYKVPLLPPEVVAYIAVTIELTTPVLLVLGLATRPAAIVLLGMTTVIEVF